MYIWRSFPLKSKCFYVPVSFHSFIHSFICILLIHTRLN
jgi:hypothetical protein